MCYGILWCLGSYIGIRTIPYELCRNAIRELSSREKYNAYITVMNFLEWFKELSKCCIYSYLMWILWSSGESNRHSIVVLMIDEPDFGFWRSRPRLLLFCSIIFVLKQWHSPIRQILYFCALVLKHWKQIQIYRIDHGSPVVGVFQVLTWPSLVHIIRASACIVLECVSFQNRRLDKKVECILP